jgi:hypothetical protein
LLFFRIFLSIHDNLHNLLEMLRRSYDSFSILATVDAITKPFKPMLLLLLPPFRATGSVSDRTHRTPSVLAVVVPSRPSPARLTTAMVVLLPERKRLRRSRRGARHRHRGLAPRLTLCFDQARGAPRLRASGEPNVACDEETQANRRHISQESEQPTIPCNRNRPQAIRCQSFFFLDAIDARYHVQARLDRFLDTVDLRQSFGTPLFLLLDLLYVHADLTGIMDLAVLFVFAPLMQPRVVGEAASERQTSTNLSAASQNHTVYAN